MPVIKNAHADSMIRSAVVLDLGDLRRQGERMIAEARSQAEGIIAEARDRAMKMTAEAERLGQERGREEGLQTGLEEGRAKGRDEAFAAAAEQLETLRAAWQQALDDWNAQRRMLQLDAQEDVLTFALELGRRIVHRAIEVEPSRVVDVVAEAVRMVRGPTSMRIEIHPDDRPLVEEALGSITGSMSSVEDIAIVEVPHEVDRGGCRVRTNNGMIDARLWMQIDRIVNTLLPGGGRLDEVQADGSDTETPPPASAGRDEGERE